MKNTVSVDSKADFPQLPECLVKELGDIVAHLNIEKLKSLTRANVGLARGMMVSEQTLPKVRLRVADSIMEFARRGVNKDFIRRILRAELHFYEIFSTLSSEFLLSPKTLDIMFRSFGTGRVLLRMWIDPRTAVLERAKTLIEESIEFRPALADDSTERVNLYKECANHFAKFFDPLCMAFEMWQQMKGEKSKSSPVAEVESRREIEELQKALADMKAKLESQAKEKAEELAREMLKPKVKPYQDRADKAEKDLKRVRTECDEKLAEAQKARQEAESKLAEMQYKCDALEKVIGNSSRDITRASRRMSSASQMQIDFSGIKNFIREMNMQTQEQFENLRNSIIDIKTRVDALNAAALSVATEDSNAELADVNAEELADNAMPVQVSRAQELEFLRENLLDEAGEHDDRNPIDVLSIFCQHVKTGNEEMQFFIDGHNVINCSEYYQQYSSVVNHNTRISHEELRNAFHYHCKAFETVFPNAEFNICWDGEIAKTSFYTDRIRVSFSGGGDFHHKHRADQDLLKQMRWRVEERPKSLFFVVSNDVEVRNYAKMINHGVTALHTSAFVTILADAIREKKGA